MTQREAAPSRSARKRDAKAVEDLARSLVALPEARIGKVPLGEGLRRELLLARNTRGHAARDRQTRHLAALLRREEDLAPLEEFLAGTDRQQREETESFHQLEEWRDRLCLADEFAPALQEIAGIFPAIDTRRLTRLAGAVHAGRDRQAAREIFRLLRTAREQGSRGAQ